ncbi:Alpha-1,3-mannosyltransferase CMT1 [Tetrabaena socialis]|uniref:Alpha-1,3-mannosyltransferase CMT1 n=1 Tax=Tetrabaena socialis TaxID=47790 RepID=A0A2J7ZQ71_9CHLO|nr:Alpha-1,3-mannosyltransferase CMT1 [Tetrabaena socialis]|eukprot:PNH02419.1 Alpha-1,3-mannosyltransferase CMT1 [Tetrabaena socialis]
MDVSVCSGKCIIVANLYNSAEVLPNMITQLVRLATLLGPANMLVSIYESGSRDATAEWLRLLRGVLGALSVPCIVTAGGNLTRRAGQDRIAFLASVRQAAVDQVLAACGGLAEGFCSADRIVYLNDVFFEATDVVRLLQYRDAHVACGLDFEPILAEHPAPEQRRFMALHLQQVWRVPGPLAARLAALTPAFRLWQKAYRRSVSLLRLLPLSFYDEWVARDVAGGRFVRPFPYTSHGPTAQRIRSGLPFAAYCCWNGLAALAGAPLLSGRVAFRAHRDGECGTSECSLLCDDLHRLGHTRVVVDPGVRVAYRAAAAERMAAGHQAAVGAPMEPAGVAYVEWRDDLPANLTAWRQPYGAAGAIERCCLAPGRDAVDFKNDCALVTVPKLR